MISSLPRKISRRSQSLSIRPAASSSSSFHRSSSRQHAQNGNTLICKGHCPLSSPEARNIREASFAKLPHPVPIHRASSVLSTRPVLRIRRSPRQRGGHRQDTRFTKKLRQGASHSGFMLESELTTVASRSPMPPRYYVSFSLSRCHLTDFAAFSHVPLFE